MLPAGFAASELMPLNYVTRSLLLLQESGETGPLTREPTNVQFVTNEERLAALRALLLSDRVLGGVLDDLGMTDPASRAVRIRDLRETTWLEGAGTNFIEIYHSGPNPTGLGKQLETVITRFLEALIPEQHEPDAIQILLEKHMRDLAAARALKVELERRQAQLSIGSPAAAQARLAELDHLRQAKAQALRQADKAVELARPAALATATIEQLEQEIDRLANPEGTEGEQREQSMRAEDAAPLRDALAKRKAALSEHDKIAAAMETEQRNISEYERLEAQIAGAERDIAAARDKLEATQKRLESVRLGGAVGILRVPELIRIVDPPRDPEFPTRSPKVYLFAALAAGILLGLGLASIAEFLDTSLRDPDEFSEVAGAPVITRIGARKHRPFLLDHPESA
ncbi:hypothetical protein ACG873_01115 (plasmid) [Mesorhizobium sp. AaZ16]|uniref:hypothetical protein n=1 Tax=Mesorhizobium sp. AaZ16 TaxID=3402289 RepID=UPI00374FB73A